MILLETKQLSLGYDNKENIKDINITVHDSDYICIIGNNGSGKTTLIKGLLGLLPPIKGEVKLSSSFLPKHIGYLPQITTSQHHFPASVYEIVSSGILNSKKFSPFLYPNEKKRINNALKKLQIEDIKHQHFATLSGGQQQKVLLARSLCATQKILILDEPITGLDEISRKEVYQLLHLLHRKEKITIIMITHNVSEVLPYVNHIWEVKEQTVVTKTYQRGDSIYVE